MVVAIGMAALTLAAPRIPFTGSRKFSLERSAPHLPGNADSLTSSGVSTALKSFCASSQLVAVLWGL